MTVSHTAEYALRAVVWLAQHPGEPQTTQALAEATRVSQTYLPKVFQHLIRAGVISGQRGVGGGYTLQRNPEALTLLDVVDCVDPIERIETCPLNLATHGANLCPLHRVLRDAIEEVRSRLSAVTIASVVRDAGDLKPLCDVVDRLKRLSRSQGGSATPEPN
jgi:Rrf2 family nitric oxide-sensitive transcriptional repressor